MNKPVIIIGSGLAGYGLAKEFRKLNQEQPLIIITADQGRAYSKPMLSNALTRNQEAGQLATATALQMAEQLNATILTETCVERIDPVTKTVYFADQVLEYSKLVLANGAEPIKLRLSGNAVEQLYSVNNLIDYEKFRIALKASKKIAIIGSGLIGCEFANDLINSGYQVTVCSFENWPLRRLLPEQPARLLQASLAEKGIEWHLSDAVVQADYQDKQYVLSLASGETITANLVLSAVGIKPDLTLAKSAGLKTNQGILVDHCLQTSDADIYALGDCIEMDDELLAYVSPIMHAARSLAKTLNGEVTPVNYPCMPIVVKTPAHSITLSKPNLANKPWQLEGDDKGMMGYYKDEEDKVRGFLLTGDKIKHRMELIKQVVLD